MSEITVTVAADIQVVQMACESCQSKLTLVLSPEAPIRALRYCPVCAEPAIFFNAEDRPA